MTDRDALLPFLESPDYYARQAMELEDREEWALAATQWFHARDASIGKHRSRRYEDAAIDCEKHADDCKHWKAHPRSVSMLDLIQERLSLRGQIFDLERSLAAAIAERDEAVRMAGKAEKSSAKLYGIAIKHLSNLSMENIDAGAQQKVGRELLNRSRVMELVMQTRAAIDAAREENGNV